MATTVTVPSVVALVVLRAMWQVHAKLVVVFHGIPIFGTEQ